MSCIFTLSSPITTKTTHVDELSFRTGDRMQVLEEGSNGAWVLVHGIDCNETGLVPYEALAEVSSGALHGSGCCRQRRRDDYSLCLRLIHVAVFPSRSLTSLPAEYFARVLYAVIWFAHL